MRNLIYISIKTGQGSGTEKASALREIRVLLLISCGRRLSYI